MLEYKYYLKDIRQTSPGIIVLEAGDKRGLPVFDFRPGQYAMISYRNQHGGVEDKHAFSLASSPTEKNLIRFGIKIEGPFTAGLLNLKVGDEIFVSGPYGKFIFDENKYSNLVMLAGGIGITPFLSSLSYATDKKLPNKLALIYSARTAAGATFLSEITALAQKNSNVSHLFSFTEEAKSDKSIGILNQRIDAAVIKESIGQIYGKTFFICGPLVFMAAMTSHLLSLGVQREQIQMEEFSMTPDKLFWPRIKNLSYALSFAVILFIFSFSLINRNAQAATKKNYNLASLNQINKIAYSRMITIYNAKNSALAALNQQLTTLKNEQGTVATVQTISTPAAPTRSANGGNLNGNSGGAVANQTPAPVINQPAVTPTPSPTPIIQTPAPSYIPPAPIIPPTPTTRVS